MELKKRRAPIWASLGVLLVGLALAATAFGTPIQWTGGRGVTTAILYLDGQRATGGYHMDAANLTLDITLVGVGQGIRYSGTFTGTRRVKTAARDQPVAGTWEADLTAGKAQVTINMARVN